jgi:hypothetical protein
MGIEWSEPKLIKSGATWVVSAKIPSESEIWELWKKFKVPIKEDGFSIKKFQGVWYVNYYHDATDDWRNDYESRVAKWSDIMEKQISVRNQMLNTKN